MSLPLCILVLAGLCVAASAQTEGRFVEKPKLAVAAFDLHDVRLLDGPCKVAQEANRRYLHALDADRLLWNFRQNAGLPTPGQPLGGWEKPDVEVRGHFTGHYLSACALMYASTGDEELKARGDKIVAELAKCQQALGGGYLSAFPASFWDRLERDAAPWAPYYTIHKIMAGLFDMYSLCGNRQALEILKGMAGYFKGRFDKLTTWQVDRLLGVEFGGMSEVLHNLYGVTGDPEHLALAHEFDQAGFLGPLALGHDDLTNIHANTHYPKIEGAARRYELLGDLRYRAAVELFWDRVANHRSYATGGSNVGEGWGDPDKLAHTLSANNEESCTTYNMLKITRYLFRWTADPRYADFYERAYFNGILGTQNPADGMLIYYLPLATGFRKAYGTAYDSFWCCTGTGVETFSKLGDSIYFHDDDALLVNLFIASQVNWQQKGVVVEQATRFPEEQGTSLTVHAAQPTEFTLKLHIPYWATRGVTVSVNGERILAEATPTSYLALKRTWKDGDRVSLDLPMSLHVQPMPDDPEMMAILYGPVVLAGLADITDRPRVFLADAAKPEDWIKPVEGKPLHFRTVGQSPELELLPLNRIVHEAYGVYWIVTKPGSARHQAILAEEEARRKREARVVDRVLANDADSEAAHNLQGQNHGSGSAFGRGWRHAPEGWFSYDLKVLPDVPMTLCCTYWGSDVPPRNFDVSVGGKVVSTISLNMNKPGEFFDVETPIPPELTQGKTKVTVRFEAHKGPGNIAGGVFECAILKP